jgi:hypothetical protein
MGNFLVKISNLEQYGGIYNNEIFKFFDKIMKNFYSSHKNYNKIDFNNLGGVYFIRDNNKFFSTKNSEEYYKIGKGNYLTKSKLIGRIESYGTYYPFGIRIRGIAFTLSNNEKNILNTYRELKFLVQDYHLSNNKEQMIKKYYTNYTKEEDLTSNYFLNKIMYIYATRVKNENIINEKMLSDLITDMFTNSLEKELDYQIKNKYEDSKNFIKKIWTRDNYGEFFKINSSDLLDLYLQIDGIDNQLLIYFPKNELIFGEYNTSPNVNIDYIVYLGKNEIMRGLF